MDFMGKDSFDNIMKKIAETMANRNPEAEGESSGNPLNPNPEPVVQVEAKEEKSEVLPEPEVSRNKESEVEIPHFETDVPKPEVIQVESGETIEIKPAEELNLEGGQGQDKGEPCGENKQCSQSITENTTGESVKDDSTPSDIPPQGNPVEPPPEKALDGTDQTLPIQTPAVELNKDEGSLTTSPHAVPPTEPSNEAKVETIDEKPEAAKEPMVETENKPESEASVQPAEPTKTEESQPPVAEQTSSEPPAVTPPQTDDAPQEGKKEEAIAAQPAVALETPPTIPTEIVPPPVEISESTDESIPANPIEDAKQESPIEVKNVEPEAVLPPTEAPIASNDPLKVDQMTPEAQPDNSTSIVEEASKSTTAENLPEIVESVNPTANSELPKPSEIVEEAKIVEVPQPKVETNETPKPVESNETPKTAETIEAPQTIEKTETPNQAELTETLKSTETTENPKPVEITETPISTQNAETQNTEPPKLKENAAITEQPITVDASKAVENVAETKAEVAESPTIESATPVVELLANTESLISPPVESVESLPNPEISQPSAEAVNQALQIPTQPAEASKETVEIPQEILTEPEQNMMEPSVPQIAVDEKSPESPVVAEESKDHSATTGINGDETEVLRFVKKLGLKFGVIFAIALLGLSFITFNFFKPGTGSDFDLELKK